MRYVSYLTAEGPSFGALTETGIVDLQRLGFGPTLRAAIEAGQLGEAAAAVAGTAANFALDAVTLLPPVPDAPKILAVGSNYADHVAEMGRDIGPDPIFFSRFNQSVAAHGAPLIKPLVSDHLDYEGELALVIGRPARHVAVEDAMSYVAGYTCFNDGTIRDYQKTSIVVGKNFEHTGAMGPWMVTPDELSFPLTVETRINGERRQFAGTDTMVFDIPRLIAYASSFITLLPGDIIVTGTPSGVAARRTPPAWLVAGDVVEIEISGVGTLRNVVRNEQA